MHINKSIDIRLIIHGDKIEGYILEFGQIACDTSPHFLAMATTRVVKIQHNIARFWKPVRIKLAGLIDLLKSKRWKCFGRLCKNRFK
jgi:hypothetical protein